MKKRNVVLVLLASMVYSSIIAQCTLACYADFNLSLDASGNATISPEDVLASYGPSCGTLIVEPSSFDCTDIGAPVVYTVTDVESGNSCWGNIHVRYFVGAMSCYADVSVDLGPSGSLTLTPEMLLLDPPGACIPGAIISPSTVSCSDIGTPVFVTITDPVSGNSCWSNVTVNDPRPTSCEITVPASIYCGGSGVLFAVNVLGGYGPFDYSWEIKGNHNGWSILSGQGTDNISMFSGEGKIKLEVTITDVCGKKRKCSVKVDCEEPPASIDSKRKGLDALKSETVDDALKIFPNPVTHGLWVKYSGLTSMTPTHMYVVDQLGRKQLMIQPPQGWKEKARIDVQELPAGIYWLIMEDVVNGSQGKRFIKL